MSMALAYIDSVRHRLNLTIRANVQANRVVLEDAPEGKRAVGIEVESGDETFVVEGGEIILCAGAVASPQLLMLSGLGPVDQLSPLGIPVAVDLPGVGQNMRDHPNVSVRYMVKDDVPQDPNGMRALRLRYTATGSDTPNDMILSPASLNTVVRDDNPAHTVNCGLYLAAGKGELRLVSADPHAHPTMDYRYLEEDWDRERLREAVRLCVSFLQHGAYESVIEEITAPTPADLESNESLDAWLRRNISTSYHISGTCKMGPDTDPMSVVDQRLRVRGVSNLRIADASIMPDVVRANTNVTTMMIAERVSDFIKVCHLTTNGMLRSRSSRHAPSA